MIEGSGSGSVPLTNGPGSGWPINMRTRIPNTGVFSLVWGGGVRVLLSIFW
jgi:hypothetical protein